MNQSENLPSDIRARQDELHDSIQLSLREGAIEPAVAATRGLLRLAYNAQSTKALLTDLVDTARWELQCGADPKIVYAFLSGAYKRMGDNESIAHCARMLALYADMEKRGVNIRSMEACRLHMEQRNWDKENNGGREDRRKKFESGIGYWRQLRLLAALDPLLDLFPGASWLTIGDGRHAIEARHINLRGGCATASDVTDTVLKKAKQAGLIQEYRVEEIEKLSLPDGSYDFVEAKDMLHHSSRPWLGLHEMLRVARTGICFIEPYDHSHGFSALHPSLRPGGVNYGAKAWHAFEEGAGNYIYSFIDRELAKFCMGMGLPLLACKGFCDYYNPDIDCQEAIPGSEALSFVEKHNRDAEESAAEGKSGYSLLAFVILKRPPSRKLLARLRADGFTIIDLPRNTALEGAFLNHPAFALGSE